MLFPMQLHGKSRPVAAACHNDDRDCTAMGKCLHTCISAFMVFMITPVCLFVHR